MIIVVVIVVADLVPVRVALVDGVVVRISVAVDADSRFGRVPIVGREEAAEDRVVVAGVQIDQPRLIVVALADPAFGDGERLAGAP